MDKQNSNKKMDFKKIKKNTFNSLNEVEFFLRDFKRFSNYIKLYKMFRPKRNAIKTSGTLRFSTYINNLVLKRTKQK